VCQAGIDVVVYERDAGLAARRQGYRLHLDARAGLALQRCLPPKLFELFIATCGQPGKAFTVLSNQLRTLRRITGDPGRDPDAPQTLSTSANRLTLREVLASGLGERVRFGGELVRYSEEGPQVRLHLADDTSTTADILVGADGVNSVVRRQHLPHATVVDTGARIIYGRTPLDDTALSLIPAPLHDGFTAIIGGHVGLAAGLVRFREPPPQAAARLGVQTGLTPVGDYLMWAVSAQREHFGAPDDELPGLDAAQLHRLAQQMLRSWHPDLRALLARADVDETFLVRVRTAEPVAPWTPGRVTLLGDAIHAMSPARGSGANTALQDAALLARMLSGADPTAPGQAIGEYEALMRRYGFAAVRASREAERTAGMGWAGRLVQRVLNRSG
jgi:2-polyprenyl-6-methoxyphenol hydroxylase-like FAD-dependent oxidoreductase